jgi:flagellar basal body-associated protein FliL
MKKKLKFILPVVLLLVAGVGYKKMSAKKPVGPKPKIAGELVQLAPEFVVNLAGGRYGKLTVALQMKEPIPVAKEATGPVQPVQNDAVRAVITDTLTGVPAETLISRPGRTRLLTAILKNLRLKTDEKVAAVYFTDVAVQ